VSGPNFSLEGRVALVTGASSGLGAHFARTLAGAGAKIALAARRVERLTALAEEIEGAGGRALPLALDVAEPEAVRAVVADCETELGPLGILVNNAGVAVMKPALEQTLEDWDQVMGVNLRGAWLVAQAAGEAMVRQGQGGSIVNIASILGLRATQQLPTYGASKAALINLTRSLALEWARHDIRVNAIAPGYVETEINRQFLTSPAGEKLLKSIPQRRFGQPEDLDGALLLLCSDAGRYLTGSVITVDGGQTAAI
jgi:NAD(P)-dependent dehydrogenase (short-subunit alcohol dehydrogenase family)